MKVLECGLSAQATKSAMSETSLWFTSILYIVQPISSPSTLPTTLILETSALTDLTTCFNHST